MKFFLSFILLVVIFCSCASKEMRIVDRTYPTDKDGIAKECAWIKSEIAKAKKVGTSSPNQLSQMIEIKTQNKITILEKRAHKLKCWNELSPVQSVEKIVFPPVDECIKNCKENTSNTPEECLELCDR